MRREVAVLCLCLTGCASTFDAPKPATDRTHVVIHFALTDDMPADVNGMAISHGDVCHIKLRPSVYPDCVTHEVAHCFGWRHDDKPNQQFCFVR